VRLTEGAYATPKHTDVEDPVDDPEEGGPPSMCLKSMPWGHLLNIAFVFVGVILLGMGMSSVGKLHKDAYFYGVLILACIPIFSIVMFTIAYFETGPCADDVAMTRLSGLEQGGCKAFLCKFAGCLLCWSEWSSLLISYVICIISTVMLMLVSAAATTAYILSGICAGGEPGMSAFCPVVFMVHAKNEELGQYWDVTKFCDCDTMSSVTVSSGGICTGGWSPGTGLREMCDDQDLVQGTHNACLGCIFLIAGTVGLIAMSMRTRSRMATKMHEGLAHRVA